MWISFSFESNVINFIQMMFYWHIPLFARDRGAEYPLILCGGLLSTYNTEPYADFFDAIIIGEGAVCVTEILSHIEDTKTKSKQEILESISSIRGVYIPSLYQPILLHHFDCQLPQIRPQQTFPVNIDDYPAYTHVSSSESYYRQHSFSIEVRRGCNQNCRFCLVGTNYRLCRQLSLNVFKKLLEKAKNQGTKYIKLFYEGLDPAIIKNYFELVKESELLARVGSQRLETTSFDTISMISSFGQRKITFAPECSNRLRKVIGKSSLNDEELLEKISFAIDKGIVDIGLYFMIGLPFELKKDLKEIADLINRVHEIMISKHSEGNVVVGINPLYPKPCTALQYCNFIGQEEARKRFDYIIACISERNEIIINNNYVDETIMSSKGKPDNYKALSNKIVIETSINSILCFYQTLISRGDRQLSRVLINVSGKNPQSLTVWKQAFAQEELDYQLYYRIPEQDFYPWDIVKHTIGNEYLRNEFRLGLAKEKVEKCIQNCGICQLKCHI